MKDQVEEGHSSVVDECVEENVREIERVEEDCSIVEKHAVVEENIIDLERGLRKKNYIYVHRGTGTSLTTTTTTTKIEISPSKRASPPTTKGSRQDHSQPKKDQQRPARKPSTHHAILSTACVPLRCSW